MFENIGKVDMIITGNFNQEIRDKIVNLYTSKLGKKITKKQKVRKLIMRKLQNLKIRNVFIFNDTKSAQNSILQTSTIGYYTYSRESNLVIIRNILNPYLFNTLRSSQGIG